MDLQPKSQVPAPPINPAKQNEFLIKALRDAVTGSMGMFGGQPEKGIGAQVEEPKPTPEGMEGGNPLLGQLNENKAPQVGFLDNVIKMMLAKGPQPNPGAPIQSPPLQPSPWGGPPPIS